MLAPRPDVTSVIEVTGRLTGACYPGAVAQQGGAAGVRDDGGRSVREDRAA
jgi:hypothetical protein